MCMMDIRGVRARQAIINEIRPRRRGVKTIRGPFDGPTEKVRMQRVMRDGHGPDG